MEIRVRFFSQLRELVGVKELQMEMAAGSTVRDLLEKIYRQKPALRDFDRNILVGAGVEFVERTYALQAEDEISIMPPVQGG
jgi:MoaD family protein